MQLVLDIEMKSIKKKKGIYAEKRTASSIIVAGENLFWENVFLDAKMPLEYVFTLTYMFGIQFALCGCKELPFEVIARHHTPHMKLRRAVYCSPTIGKIKLQDYEKLS